MREILWLLAVGLPPWAAMEFGAPKWVAMLAVAPFVLFAMTLGEPDEELLGQASAKFRMAGMLFILCEALLPHASRRAVGVMGFFGYNV